MQRGLSNQWFGLKDARKAKGTSAGMKEALEALFIAPFASHEWQSARARSHWVELEGWQDAMAGPLSSIANSGGCQYVYNRQDGYFPGVVDPESLLHCLLDCHAGLVAGVEAFCPATSAEAEDQRHMMAIADGMRALVESGCEIERARWATESRGRTHLWPRMSRDGQ
jgi:hypothetical protein